MIDNNMNFEEFKLYLKKQYKREEKHVADMWLAALKVHANITSLKQEFKKSQWEKFLYEVKNKKITN